MGIEDKKPKSRKRLEMVDIHTVVCMAAWIQKGAMIICHLSSTQCYPVKLNLQYQSTNNKRPSRDRAIPLL
jgi:hypothetical protein